MSLTYFACPYCTEMIDVEVESQNQMDKYTDVCFKCKKKFNYNIVFDISINAYRIGDKA